MSCISQVIMHIIIIMCIFVFDKQTKAGCHMTSLAVFEQSNSKSSEQILWTS